MGSSEEGPWGAARRGRGEQRESTLGHRIKISLRSAVACVFCAAFKNVLLSNAQLRERNTPAP